MVLQHSLLLFDKMPVIRQQKHTAKIRASLSLNYLGDSSTVQHISLFTSFLVNLVFPLWVVYRFMRFFGTCDHKS